MELQRTAAPGTTVNGWVKAPYANSGPSSKPFAGFEVESAGKGNVCPTCSSRTHSARSTQLVPLSLSSAHLTHSSVALAVKTGASIRAGTINAIGCRVPGGIGRCTTGHEYKGASAMYEYYDIDRPLAIPGAVAVMGWPAFKWGQLGKGQVPPSLDPLKVLR